MASSQASLSKIEEFPAVIVSSQEDLREYPEKLAPKLLAYPHFSIGDKHGHTLSMIRDLIKIDALDVSRQQYEQLRDAFYAVEKNANDLENIKLFAEVLSHCKVKEPFLKSTKNPKFIRFAGDTMGDRRGNDVLNLFFYQAINTANHVVLISNHDMEYITHSEKGTLNNLQSPTNVEPCTSLLNLKQFLASQKEIDLKQIQKMEEESYYPHLRFLSYSLPQDEKNNNKARVYVHARPDLLTVEKTAKLFGIDVTNLYETTQDLASIIKKINKNMVKLHRDRRIHKLFKDEKDRMPEGMVSSQATHEFPIAQLIWKVAFDEAEAKKNNQAKYEVEFIHGHTGSVHCQGYTSLDSLFGKTPAHDAEEWRIYASSGYYSSSAESASSKESAKSSAESASSKESANGDAKKPKQSVKFSLLNFLKGEKQASASGMPSSTAATSKLVDTKIVSAAKTGDAKSSSVNASDAVAPNAKVSTTMSNKK